MYEDRPEKDTPLKVQVLLREYGGESPDGQPIWRLVLARNCRIHCFGTMNHLPDGMNVHEMPEFARPTDVTPARIEQGEFWVPRSRQKGWILQRWFPASMWGSVFQWENEKALDGRTRLLAAFPRRGDYFTMPCGPWNSIVEAGDLTGAIRSYNMQQRRNPANWQNLMESQIALEVQEREREVEAYADEIAAQHRLGIAGMLTSVSESAQRFRNQVAAATAGGVNLGASEKWG